MDKLVNEMTEKELVSVFSSDKSNRMEVLKAGERLLKCEMTLSEFVCYVLLVVSWGRKSIPFSNVW